MEDFGFDIAEEVIARSNCVSDKCQPLISNTSAMKNIPKLLIFSRSENKYFSFLSLEQKSRFKSLCSPMEEHLLSCRKFCKIIPHSSCNGLSLIQIYKVLFVWNPLTSFFKKVLTFAGLDRECNGQDSSAELCFDSSRDKYKVVLVYGSHSDSCPDTCIYFATFGATFWEKIEAPYTIDNVHLVTLFKGKKHWICKGHLSHYNFDRDVFHIIYFNPHTNLFVEVPMPQTKNGDRDNTLVGLGVLDECLCMTRLDDREGKIEFLAMKEYGNEDSWVTLFVISNPLEFRRNNVMEPLFKTKEGEVFVSMYMCDSGSSRHTGPSVKCYDVNGKFLRDILVPSENNCSKVILYEESWASPRVNDYEKHLDLWELEDSFRKGFCSRKKKKNKKIEKNHHQIKKKNKQSKRNNSLHGYMEISTRRKGNKRKYESRLVCANFHLQHDLSAIHENIPEGGAAKINKARAPQISYKTSVIGKLYNTSMISSCCDIAEDVLIELLSRLPIKNLARLKCVSKQWQYLISNAVTFKYVPKLLMLSSLKNKCCLFHLLDQEIRIKGVCSPMEEKLLNGHEVKAHSSFNGFLLIQIDKDLVMWNPLTKFFRKVPMHKGIDGSSHLWVQADLCFDYANDEYKILLVYYYSTHFYVATCGDSNWEELYVPITVKNDYQGPCFKGYRHYICEGRYSPFHRSNGIVYFDPSTNEFIELATPQPKKGETDTIVGLGVVDECLCMTRWDGIEYYEGNTEFLVMKEYGNGDSWEIMFVISNVPLYPSKETLSPLFKTKGGEILVCRHNGGNNWSVKAYDVTGKFLRDILASPDCSHCWDRNTHFKLLLYEETCFSPLKLLENVKSYV